MIVVDLDDHRRVWLVTRAECAGCGKMTARVTHKLKTDDTWETRIADVVPIRGGSASP